MSVASVMVHLDGGDAAERRLGLAQELAKQFGAALVIVAARQVEPRFLGGGDIAGDEPDEQDIARAAALLDQLGKHVRARLGSQPVDWRAAVSYPTEFLVRQAATADVIVIGQEPAEDSAARLDIDGTVVKAGRPILIVPNAVGALTLRRVVIAWNNSRAARRALKDAIPMLQLAEEIALIEFRERTSEPSSQEQLAAITAYLAAHKIVRPAAHLLDSQSNVGNELLDYAQGFRADLIVAGGYGQSRLGELIFRGVSRELVAKSPVCCLLSH